MLVLCLNVYKLYDDGFLVHYNACHVKYSTEVVTEAT